MISDNICGGRTLRIAVGITALVLLLVSGAEADTFTVNASGGGANYTRIQDAVDNASAGDTILVYSGTYYENVNVNKQLILRGIDDGGGKPVVDANGSGSSINLNTGNNILDGFASVNAGNIWGDAGIRTNSNNNIITNNNASNNREFGISLIYSNNNTLSGNNASNNDYGIYLYSSSNNTLMDNTVSSNSYGGLHLDHSNNNTLSNNTANSNTNNGIYLYSSSNNTLSSNNVNSNGGMDLWVSGFAENDFNNNIDITNKVNGKPVYYLFDQKNVVFEGIETAHLTLAYSSNIIIKNSNISNGDGIALFNTTNSTLIGVNASNNDYGIYLRFSNNNTLSDNIANSNDGVGIEFDFSNNNTLSGNTVNSNFEYGIILHDSNNNRLIGNNVSNTLRDCGIAISSSNNNILSGNMVKSNIYDGIRMEASSNNTLNDNNVSNNEYLGIVLFSSSNNNTLSGNNVSNNEDGIFIHLSSTNLIYNNIFNNTNNVDSEASNNFWNTSRTLETNIIGGPYRGGNFWANPNSTGFSQTCADADMDGICDSNYTLDANNTDYLPLAYNASPVPPPPVGGGGGGGAGGGGGGSRRTITVDDSGGANYTRIHDAIDNASDGDTILVYSGTYYENVNVTKQLIMKGIDTGSGNPVVDGGGNARAITISADGVMLEGFKAMNAPYLYGSGTGIYVQSNNNTIKNNIVSNNNYAGIFLASTSYYSDTINNTLSYNMVSNNGVGIYLYYSSNNVLIGNTANSNRDHGILLWPSNNNTLGNNTVNTNGIDGISFGYSSDNVIVGNTALNNPIGISLDFSSNNNLIYDNSFNNTNNFFSEGGATNNAWNIMKVVGLNIIGGPYLGGNFWAHPNGTGFSQTCADADKDGICDSNYTLDANNTDYQPLAYNAIILDSTKPIVTNLSISTFTPIINTSVKITAKVSDANLNTSSVFVSVKHPSGYTNISPMDSLGNGTYSYNYTNTSEYGRYNVTIIASDLAGNINNTVKTWFVTTKSQRSSVSIRGGGSGEIAYGPMVWNSTNFPGLVVGEMLNVTDVTGRTIPKTSLIYTTTAQPKVLEVATALNLTGNNTGLTYRGLQLAAQGKAFDNGMYYVIGWQGGKYVALNRKVDKLAKLAIEQDSSDKKVLMIGETWNIGDGYSLKLNSIDVGASPRQVWLTLGKDGVAKDDKVVAEGYIYTYLEKTLATETDVPLFVTYADNITSNAIQLKYTWAISTNVTTINSSGTYGIFKDANVDNFQKILSLRNSDSSVNLSQDATINLMDGLYFRVTNNASLEYYPFFEPVQVNASEVTDVTLEMLTDYAMDGTIEINEMIDIPPEMNTSFVSTPFGKYVTINASQNIRNNLTWMKFKFYYTQAELDASGLDENSLRMSWCNESSDPYGWEILSPNSQQWVHGTGVEIAGTGGYAGYVWANISHLSTFALIGEPIITSTYTPPPSSGGSGGGGGGGGGASGENFSNVIVREKYDEAIFKDKVTSYKFKNASNPITHVNVTGKVNAGLITAMIEVLKGTSTLVKEAPPGIVNKNVNLWLGTSGFAVPKNLKEVVIRFRVENSWMQDNNVDARDIKLLRWDSTSKKWMTLKTEVKEKDGTDTFFEATTNSLSPLAISAVVTPPGGPVAGAPPAATPPGQGEIPSAPKPKGTPGFEGVITIAAISALYIWRKRDRV